MYITISAPFGIPDHFYPWLNGDLVGQISYQLLLVPITPVGSVKDERPTKRDFLVLLLLMHMSIRPFVCPRLSPFPTSACLSLNF